MKRLKEWHETKLGLLIFAVVELAVAYGLLSWAFDNGNLLLYILVIILVVGFFQNIVRLIGKFVHGNKTTEA